MSKESLKINFNALIMNTVVILSVVVLCYTIVSTVGNAYNSLPDRDKISYINNYVKKNGKEAEKCFYKNEKVSDVKINVSKKGIEMIINNDENCIIKDNKNYGLEEGIKLYDLVYTGGEVVTVENYERYRDKRFD